MLPKGFLFHDRDSNLFLWYDFTKAMRIRLCGFSVERLSYVFARISNWFTSSDRSSDFIPFQKPLHDEVMESIFSIY